MRRYIESLKGKYLFVRNLKFIRFPTLTRIFLDAPALPTKIHGHDYDYSDETLNRICLAFERASDAAAGEDVWTGLATSNAGFIEALNSHDYAYLRDAFGKLFHGSLTEGMAHTAVFLSPKSPYDLRYFTLRCRDATLALAEALAIKGLASNQQTSLAAYRASTNCDLQSHLEKIEEVLGHTVAAPPVGRPPVAVVGGHVVSPDSLRHAYVMYRVKQLGFVPESAILEIGGGFGNVARYAFLQGFRDYTIIDIPYVAAIQAAFLAATVGAENISLFGEPATAAIKIVPSTKKGELDRNYNLTINMDSIPEINEAESRDYLAMIRAKSDYFLSINQEAEKLHNKTITQQSVPKLVGNDVGFSRAHRHPYWMEQGYAEELYKIQR